METFWKLARVNYAVSAIFCIPSVDGNMFMRVNRTNALNEERYVVEVDTHRFLSLWRNTTDSNHAAIARGNSIAWKQDRKFLEAKAGFAQGEINPVPLAEVSCFLSSDKKNRINIVNGVTRTIYLMVVQVEKFPVECMGIKQARLLQEFAGLPNSHFKTVEELIPE